jgi:DNA-binding response OmpR family regulator
MTAESERLRIPLVDQESATLEIVSDALRSACYSHCFAPSGEDALRQCLLIGPGGKDLLKRLRTLTSAPIFAGLTRPFATEELPARFTTGDPRVDFNSRAFFLRSEQIRLSATEYQLLNLLVRHAGRVRTHHQLIHEVSGSTQYQDTVHLRRMTVSKLRRKLTADSSCLLPLVTEPGAGYRLQ